MTNTTPANATIAKIQAVVDCADEMRSAYFWAPPATASSRRWYEEQHSADLVEWEEGGRRYSAEFVTSCSCRNIYARGYYYRDGAKTTLTAVKNSLKRLEAAESPAQSPAGQGI